jgi:uncharacterized protein with ParB-like and HNH nuclease domain
MDGKHKPLSEFLQGKDKLFKIPIYQRNYDWKKENCLKLIEDILFSIDKDIENYFIGSFISIYSGKKNGVNEWLIIDGQQRLTTISIILIVLRDLFKDSILIEEINETYLINKNKEETGRIRLKSIKKDYVYFKNLLEEKIDFSKKSKINENYTIIKEKLKEENQEKLKKIYETIENLMVIDISLESGKDDPQLIFESMNSTGLNLEQSDLVRNFILMNQKDQDRLFEEYWNEIEKLTNYKVSDFIKNYLILKTNKTQVENKIYLNFKEYVFNTNFKENIEELLKDLLKFSKYYNKIIKENFENKKINLALKNLNKLKQTTTYSFLMELFESQEKKEIDDSELINILNLIESYILRRIICDVQTNSLNKTFMILGKEIKKHKDNNSYFEILKYILNAKTSYQRFPKNEEFIEKLKTKQIYILKSDYKNYFFEKIEHFEKRNILNFEETSIEHIMPQTLTSDWKNELGENYKEIHEKYLNTLGNLTLLNLGDNSEISNNSFKFKLEFIKKQSSYSLNEYFKNNSFENWSKEEIEKRSENISNLCLGIWKYQKSDFLPKKNEELTFSLDSEENFTGKRIKNYNFLNGEIGIKNWWELYVGVCKELYNKNEEIFKNIIDNKKILENTEKYFKINENNELEFLMYHSVTRNLALLKRILDEYGINYDELSFYISS